MKNESKRSGKFCKDADSKGGKRQGVEDYDKGGQSVAGDSSPDGYIFGRLYDTAQFEPISRYYEDERTVIEQGRRFFNL